MQRNQKKKVDNVEKVEKGRYVSKTNSLASVK